MITVVGSSRNSFLPTDSFRDRFIVDARHEGENIDFLNPFYCELTGLYYMWKNSQDDIAGLEHYRRYFVDGRGLLGRDRAGAILECSDIILIPHHHPSNRTTYDWFVGAGKRTDLDKWLITVRMHEPEFYDVLWKYMLSNKLYVCNMFVTRRDIMERWCSWLFPMLMKYDQAAGLGHHNRRIDGYLAEHTLGAWAMWQGLRIAEGKMKMV